MQGTDSPRLAMGGEGTRDLARLVDMECGITGFDAQVNLTQTGVSIAPGCTGGCMHSTEKEDEVSCEFSLLRIDTAVHFPSKREGSGHVVSMLSLVLQTVCVAPTRSTYSRLCTICNLYFFS